MHNRYYECCAAKYQNGLGLEDIKLAYFFSWISTPLGLILKSCKKKYFKQNSC